MIVSVELAIDFVSIVDRGSPVNERIHFHVKRDCNLSFFIVIATIEAGPNKVYPGGRPAYWFESRDAKAGDHVVIYTTKGLNTTLLRDDGHVNHFFYWGAAASLFVYPGAKVVIAEINRWETKG